MGRPRKDPGERLSRVVTARVRDDQYDFLVDHAIGAGGDMSEGLRDVIDLALLFDKILRSPSPMDAMAKMLQQRDEDRARDEIQWQADDELREDLLRQELLDED